MYSVTVSPFPALVNVTCAVLGGVPRELINHRNRLQLQLLISVEFISRAGPIGVCTKGVSMKTSNFLSFRAFSTVVSKRNFQKSPLSWIPLCGNPFGVPCRINHCRYRIEQNWAAFDSTWRRYRWPLRATRGFTKTIPWAEDPGKISRIALKTILVFY